MSKCFSVQKEKMFGGEKRSSLLHCSVFYDEKSFVTSASGVLSFHLHLSPRFDYEEPIVETKGVLSNFIQKQTQQQKYFNSTKCQYFILAQY